MSTSEVPETASQAHKALIARRKAGVTWKSLLALFPPNTISKNGLDQILKKKSLKGSQTRIIDAFSEAWSAIERSNCEECLANEFFASRLLEKDANGVWPSVPLTTLGHYRIFTRLFEVKSHHTDEHKEHNVFDQEASIEKCPKCARLVFSLQESASRKRRSGGLFALPGRLHVLFVKKGQFEHIILRTPDNMDTSPMLGIALVDFDTTAMRLCALMVAAVKTGSALDQSPNLKKTISSLLATSRRDIEGVLMK